MFPDWMVEQLFQPVASDTDNSPVPRGQEVLPRKNLGQLLGIVETGLRQPDSAPPAWGPASTDNHRSGPSPKVRRMPREVWFQYANGPISIMPTKHNDRAIVIQRIHDAGSLAKFAFKISPPLGSGERTVVRYMCEDGVFRDEWYWRQTMPRYTRRYTLNVRHLGLKRLSECTATVEHSDGSEASVTEGLLWDYGDHGVSLTLAADYLRPGQSVELRWDTDSAAS